jgi:hypothetical protein
MNFNDENYSQNGRNRRVPVNNGASGAVYGLGLIGAAIYFIGHAVSFWGGVLGFLKAIIWPVFMVLKAFEFLAK